MRLFEEISKLEDDDDDKQGDTNADDKHLDEYISFFFSSSSLPPTIQLMGVNGRHTSMKPEFFIFVFGKLFISLSIIDSILSRFFEIFLLLFNAKTLFISLGSLYPL